MKKFLLSLCVVVSFIGYALLQRSGGSSATVSSSTLSSGQANTVPETNTPASTEVPVVTPVVVKPKGMYVDGSYTGTSADAYYGFIQVKAVIKNGKIADVQFVRSPNDRDESREINGRAMPQLRSEALAVQNAKVDIISGATDTSEAFVTSLGSALAKAKA